MLIAAATLWQGCATDQSPAGISQVGRVEQVYVEAYPGLFVDRALATAAGDKPRWVTLSFPQPLADGRRNAMALLENLPEIEPGDLVRVQLAAGPLSFNAEGEPESNRVTALVARRGDPNAATFGGRARAPGWTSATASLR
jgi:hypothetical protein